MCCAVSLVEGMDSRAVALEDAGLEDAGKTTGGDGPSHDGLGSRSLQKTHTAGTPRQSMSRPWLSGSYDSKSPASTPLDSEAVAMLSTKGSGSLLTFASQKRDAEFHELFPLLEKSEFLIEGV